VWLLPLLLASGFGYTWLDAAPRFSIRTQDGVTWLADSSGQHYFSFGINVANRGEDHVSADSEPRMEAGERAASSGYRASSFYSNHMEWAAATARRLDRWGFNTIGGWSDWELLRKVPGAQFAHTPVLHIGAAAGAPWRDMWNTRWLEIMEAAPREKIRVSDSRVIGHYSDNELDWWNGALFRHTLDHPASSGQRQRLVELLREQYEDDWSLLLDDFEPEGATSFEELNQAGQVYLRPGSSGISSYRRFLGMIAAQYYRTTSEIIRSKAPQGLLLGDRFRTSYYPELVRAAAAETDVISTNLKASWNDGTFARFYLDSLHSLSGKPIIVSEIYLASTENRSGNRNRKGGFPTVMTQDERAAAARRSLLELAGLPYVVGVDWFQYYDEPPGGRFDGEDFNMGLVDIDDRPYSGLVKSLSSFNLTELHLTADAPRPNATQGVPPSPADPAGRWRPFEALREWDRERGFVPATATAPFADLYLAWDGSGLWLGLYALDLTERDYYQDRVVPEADRMRWRLAVNDTEPRIDIRIGTALPGVHTGQQSLENWEYRTLAHDTRAIAAVRISAQSLGKAELKSGDVIRLESTLDAHARAERVDWSGNFRLVP
jgi:hypothetical protein